MPSINKDHARRIAKKLKAEIDTSPKAHDLACIYHNGVLIATFGIRRGSKKELGHGHIPADLHLSLHNALELARCPLSRERWLEMLAEQGWIDAAEPPAEGSG